VQRLGEERFGVHDEAADGRPRSDFRGGAPPNAHPKQPESRSFAPKAGTQNILVKVFFEHPTHGAEPLGT
jgi:hypothetical protein